MSQSVISSPGRVQTSGPLTILTYSIIELFFNLT